MDVKRIVFCSQISVRSQDVDTPRLEMILQFGEQIIGVSKSSNQKDNLYVKW